MRYAPVLPVVIPLFTAALIAALTKLLPQRVALALSLLAAALTTAASAFLVRASLPNTIVYWFGGWSAHGGKTLGISFAIDPIGAGLAAFAGLLTFLALLFSAKYFDTAHNYFYALTLAFLAGMSGFTLTGDMFNLFVFFELMSAAAFALCGQKTEDPSSLQGSLNFAVTNTIGAYFVLTGIGLLYARTSALNMAQMGRALAAGPADGLVMTAFAFVVCGYLVKAAAVPFHFWLADAHAVAPTPICVLFSGVMVEMGLYAVARIYWTVFDPSLHRFLPQLRVLFISVGVATAIVAGIECYSQRNLKRLLAFSTISHMGLMTAGVGLFTVAGLAGTAIYTLGHGLVKGALFLAAGILLHRMRTVDEAELHGRGRSTKWAGLVFFLGAAGLAGIFPSGLALGGHLIHASAKAIGFEWLKWILFFAAGITAAAVFRAALRIFFGWGSPAAHEGGGAPKDKEAPETKGGHRQTPAWMWAPALAMVLGGLLIGIAPGLKQSTLQAAARFENASGYAARVLEGTPIQAAAPRAEMPWDPWLGLFVLVVAVAVATAHVSSKRFRKSVTPVIAPLSALHRLHSGHVGDYVAFLTFGIAVFGFVCLFTFK
ncbi:MAG: complex I subunit 5 family protein [Bryobacteraceae bacterium]